jgi:hypothetical protein
VLISSVVETDAALLATEMYSFLSAQFVTFVVVSKALAVETLAGASEISPIAPLFSSRKTVVSDISAKEITTLAIEITSGQLRSPFTMAILPSSLETETPLLPVRHVDKWK